jgi:hypothetical protein
MTHTRLDTTHIGNVGPRHQVRLNPEADARTRTGDPFITRERQVGDARPRAGTIGHLFPGDQAVSAL